MEKAKLWVPPYYFGIVAACFAGIWGAVMKWLGWESTRHPPYMDSRAFFWLGIGVLILSLFHYTFDENKLTVRWLGIPLRKISYERITGAVWITKTSKRKGITFNDALVLTIAPYQLTDKVVESIDYRRRNLFRTIHINLPVWKDKDDVYFQRLKGYLKDIPVRGLDHPTII